ncbi:hypothetical protein FRC07_008400, partial [Ceratobasidium sp. 392]
FVVLSRTVPPIDQSSEGPEIDSKGVSAMLEQLDDELASEDAELEVSPVVRGSLHHFEAELNDGVSLSKFLSGLISNRSSVSIKRSSSPELFAADAQPPQQRQPVNVSMVGY